jgi:hypothetical protein
MADLDTKFKIKVSSQLVSIAIAKNILLPHVFELADREVDGTPSCESTISLDSDNLMWGLTHGRSAHHTLFRGNTVLTKTIESLMAWYGKVFLEASMGATIRRLCLENVSIEVDPLRNAKGPKDVERNVDVLVYWCREIWEQIYSVRQQCPKYVSFIRRWMFVALQRASAMRILFEHIRQLVERRYPPKENSTLSNSELPRQSVSAFCFLRFIVPAILHPHLFGLCSGMLRFSRGTPV